MSTINFRVKNITKNIFFIILGQSPFLKFIQLYSSPTYEDFHSLLIQPDTDASSEHNMNINSHDEDKHRFSPIICHGVCDGGQIVWANTRISEGLTGRIDLPLNTAVGVPICSIGNDIYILVLFAVGLITVTPQAVEYLTTVTRAITEGSCGFLAASITSSPIISVKTDDFVGIWDISELVAKYSSDVEFHVLPVNKLQKFFDCHEILLFCDLFSDFKLTRDGRFTVKQLKSLREAYKSIRERSDSLASFSSHTWDLPAEEQSASLEQPYDHSVGAGYGQHVIVSDGDSVNDFASSGDNSAGHGVFSADLNSIEHDLTYENDIDHEGITIREIPSPRKSSDQYSEVSKDEQVTKSVLQIYAHMTYKLSQCRFHEFMIAILGMTVFESAELWLLSERTKELFLVAAVYRTPNMQKWVSFSETLRLQIGDDVPGIVLESGSSYWETNYGRNGNSIHRSELRQKIAVENDINTVLGVPLPGLRGVCGSVVFYTSKANFSLDPLLVLLIERAVQFMATTTLETSRLPSLNHDVVSPQTVVESNLPLTRWLESGEATSFSSSENIPSMKSDRRLLSRKLPDFDEKLELCRSIVNSYPPDINQNDIKFSTDNCQLEFHPDFADDPPGQPLSIMSNPFETATITNFASPHFQDPQVYDTVPNSEVNQVSTDAGDQDMAFCEPINSTPVFDSFSGLHDASRSDNDLSTLHKCKVEDCSSKTEGVGSLYCATHRGTRRCQKDGCTKCAQGATKFCIAHGGGRRCTFPGCFKGARDKYFCAAHGGGKRCQHNGCTKSAVGGSSLCTAHGGGKRCQFPGCSKSSQSSTNFCVRHGGGRSCAFRGCPKVARGKTNFCAAHGGGVRCRYKGCSKLAVGSKQLCRTHANKSTNEHMLNPLASVDESYENDGFDDDDGGELDILDVTESMLNDHGPFICFSEEDRMPPLKRAKAS